jgi:hypothetical protein
MGMSADQIVTSYPQLTLAGVYSALAFYYSHRAELDEQREAGRKMVDELRQKYPSKLQSKRASDE